MWEAGCRIVYLGLESVNPETLRALSQRVQHRRHVGGLAALHKRGNQNPRHVCLRRGHRYARITGQDRRLRGRTRPEQRPILRADAAPGTPQTAQFEAEGRIFTKNWSLYDGLHVVFWPKRMPDGSFRRPSRGSQNFYKGADFHIRHQGSIYRRYQLQGYLDQPGLGARGENREFMQRAQGVLGDARGPDSRASTRSRPNWTPQSRDLREARLRPPRRPESAR